MKKLTKITLTIITLSIALFSFSACQEDVYPDSPDFETLEMAAPDLVGETNDGGEDEGVDPR